MDDGELRSSSCRRPSRGEEGTQGQANRFQFAKFIEAERRSLTALVAPVTAFASTASKHARPEAR